MNVIEALMARNADALRLALSTQSANANGPGGTSALRLAIYLRFAEGIASLMAAGATVDAGDAAALGDTPRLRSLVGEEPARLIAQGADGFTPLHLAAHFGHEETLRALLELGVAPGIVGGPALRNTPLHAALAGGQVGCARLLLAAAAPVDARDHLGNTPLHVAAARGDLDACRLLVKASADAGARSTDGRTPSDIATERHHADVATFLAPR